MGFEVALAVSAAAAFKSAQASRAAFELEEIQIAEQAELASIESSQQEVTRSQQLRATLAALTSSTAASGFAVGVGSTRNLGLQEIKLANQDISSIRLLGHSTQRKYGLEAFGAKESKKSATLGGITEIASIGAKYYT